MLFSVRIPISQRNITKELDEYNYTGLLYAFCKTNPTIPTVGTSVSDKVQFTSVLAKNGHKLNILYTNEEFIWEILALRSFENY